MAITDYNTKKQLDVESVSGTPTVDKAQPILVRGDNYKDTWEDGNFSNNPNWTESGTGGTVSVSSTKAKNGSNSLFIESNTNANANIRISTTTNDALEVGDVMRTWLWIDDTLANAEYIVRSNGTQVAIAANTFSIDLTGPFADQEIVSSPTVNQWYLLEIEITESFGDVEVVGRVYDQNKNELGDTFGNEVSITGGADIDIELESDNLSNEAQQIYFDDTYYRPKKITSLNEGSVTGNGDIIIDFTNISDEQDIAVYDQNGNLLDYEIENLNTTAETATLWCYNSWVRDGTTQAQIAYGNNSANVDRQNVTGTWSNTNQDAEFVQHLDGNAIDSTSNNFDGTINGATSINNGQFNGSFSFDGTDDYINIGELNGGTEPSSYVLTAWFKADSLDTTSHIAQSDGNSLYLRTQSDGNLYVYVQDGFGNFPNVSNGSTLSTGQWYHGAIVYNGSQIELFLDGVSQGTASVSNGLKSAITDLSIGRNEKVDSTYFPGDIDETRMYIPQSSIDQNWMQAEYDASPKAGQVFFSQQAAEPATTTDTITLPESSGTGTTPNPQVNAGGATVNLPESTATGTTPNPAVFTDLFASIPVSSGNGATPEPQLVAGATTIKVPETTATGTTPNPALFQADLIRAPVSTGTGSTPNPAVKGGLGEIAVPASTGTGSTPNPAVFTDLTVSVPVSTGGGATPEPQLVGGATSFQVPESLGTGITPEPEIAIIVLAPDVTPPTEFIAESMDKYFNED